MGEIYTSNTGQKVNYPIGHDVHDRWRIDQLLLSLTCPLLATPTIVLPIPDTGYYNYLTYAILHIMLWIVVLS